MDLGVWVGWRELCGLTQGPGVGSRAWRKILNSVLGIGNMGARAGNTESRGSCRGRLMSQEGYLVPLRSLELKQRVA